MLDSCAVYRRDGALLNVGDVLSLPSPTAREGVQDNRQALFDPGLVTALQGARRQHTYARMHNNASAGVSAQQLPLWRDWPTLCALCYRQPIWAAASVVSENVARLSHGLSAVSVAAAALAVSVPRALPPGVLEGPSANALKGLVRLVGAAPLQQGYAARLASLQELVHLGVLSGSALQEAGICVARMGAACVRD